MSKNRYRQNNQSQSSSQMIEQAYATHVRQFPNLHDPDISNGTATEAQLKQDFATWLGGAIAAARKPHILSVVNKLSNSLVQGTQGRGTSLFNFIRQPGDQSDRGTSTSVSRLSTMPSGGNSLDNIMQHIVSDYSTVRRTA